MRLQKVENTKALMNITEAKEDISLENPEEVEVIEEPAPAEEEKPAEEIKIEEKDQSVISFSETINSLTQNYWNNISYIKSVVVMLKEQETSFPKEDIINILNSLADDATIGVGMLAKASELIDDSTKKLMDAGTEKAEEIISEPASTDL